MKEKKKRKKIRSKFEKEIFKKVSLSTNMNHYRHKEVERKKKKREEEERCEDVGKKENKNRYITQKKKIIRK